MNRLRFPALWCVALALGIAYFYANQTPAPGVSTRQSQTPGRPASPVLDGTQTPPAVSEIAPAEVNPHRPPAPVPTPPNLPADSAATLAAFDSWTTRYLAATPAERESLRTEGAALARTRQPVF